jgi:glycyl-tRNA synthetase (class II)
MKAPRPLKEPKKINVIFVSPDKKKLGTLLRKDSKPILDAIERWSDEEKEAY